MVIFMGKTVSKKGFTIVELAIVLVVIGIILAMVLKGKQLIEVAIAKAELAKIMKLQAATSIYYTYVNGSYWDMVRPGRDGGASVALGVVSLKFDHMESLNIISFEQLKSRYKSPLNNIDTYWAGYLCIKLSAGMTGNQLDWVAIGPGYNSSISTLSICASPVTKVASPTTIRYFDRAPQSKRMVCLIENTLDDENMRTGDGMGSDGRFTPQSISPQEYRDCFDLSDKVERLDDGIYYAYAIF